MPVKKKLSAVHNFHVKVQTAMPTLVFLARVTHWQKRYEIGILCGFCRSVYIWNGYLQFVLCICIFGVFVNFAFLDDIKSLTAYVMGRSRRVGPFYIF